MTGRVAATKQATGGVFTCDEGEKEEEGEEEKERERSVCYR